MIYKDCLLYIRYYKNPASSYHQSHVPFPYNPIIAWLLDTRKMRVIAWLVHPTEPSSMEKWQCLVAPAGAKDWFRLWWMCGYGELSIWGLELYVNIYGIVAQ